MNCQEYEELIGEAVDGTLGSGPLAQVQEHCRGCSNCRDLLTDFVEIRAAAAALERRTPSPEVWQRIEASLSTSLPARRSNWYSLAAAAALVAMLGAAAWFGLRADRVPQRASDADLARSAASELQLAEEHYERAIASLEQLMAEKQPSLDPAVFDAIAPSLRSIDRAIADCRTALNTDPGSLVAQRSLLEALRMKVALLQETVTMMNGMS